MSIVVVDIFGVTFTLYVTNFYMSWVGVCGRFWKREGEGKGNSRWKVT